MYIIGCPNLGQETFPDTINTFKGNYRVFLWIGYTGISFVVSGVCVHAHVHTHTSVCTLQIEPYIHFIYSHLIYPRDEIFLNLFSLLLKREAPTLVTFVIFPQHIIVSGTAKADLL